MRKAIIEWTTQGENVACFVRVLPRFRLVWRFSPQVQPWQQTLLPTMSHGLSGAITRHVDQATLGGKLTQKQLDDLADAGEKLFSARFTLADGVGRPMATQAITPVKRKRPVKDAFFRTAGMDSNGCSSCHNQPFAGGAGDFAVNVFVSEGFTNADFDTLDPQFSNERNTNHLFGSGLVELLAREMTSELHQLRRDAVAKARASGEEIKLRLITKGVDFGTLKIMPDGMIDLEGLDGIDTDLAIRPFSQKGVMTSLRQFYRQCPQPPSRHAGGRALWHTVDRRDGFRRGRQIR
ncbi:MAG: hypothetical protein R3D29_09870 [Nitratireductor sp.]